jgi:hypothetical protein
LKFVGWSAAPSDGKGPRTVTMETASELRPRDPNAAEIRPLSLKGRAWIAADAGQVIRLETILVESIPMIELDESAFSADCAPAKFQSQNVEVWLPQLAVGYTDYAKRRMIVEHAFSDFQFFSVQTQDVIQKPKEAPPPAFANSAECSAPPRTRAETQPREFLRSCSMISSEEQPSLAARTYCGRECQRCSRNACLLP